MSTGKDVIILKISEIFTRTPGPRFEHEGPFSGATFRTEILIPYFEKALQQNKLLLVDLDGGYGYATSFLEEAFGGLGEKFGATKVLSILTVKSIEEPTLMQDVRKYISGRRASKNVDS